MSNIMNQILHISMVSSGIIIVLLVVNYFLTKKYSLKWMQMLWLLVVIRLLLPSNLFTIAIPITHKVQNVDNVLMEEQDHISAVNKVSKSVHEQDYPERESSIENKKLQSSTYHYRPLNNAVRVRSSKELLKDGFAILWLLGTMFFVVRYLVTCQLMKRRIMRYNEPIAESDYLVLFGVFREKGTGCKVYKNKRVKAPFSFGIIHKAIILPEKEYTKDELEVILCHEYTHIRNHDIEFKMLLYLAKAIHWFNPLVYMMERTINQNMELICDEEVIREQNLEYRKMYGMTILNTLKEINGQSMFIGATHFEGEKKQIKERFKNIIKPSNRGKKPIVLTVIMIVIFATSLITCKTVSSSKENGVEVESNVLEARNAGIEEAKETKLDPISILAIGYENINEESLGNGRSDCVLLLTWKPEIRQLAIQSLCRDMLVTIPGEEDNKLSAAYYCGGSLLLQETVEQNYGVKVNYVATVGFNQFRNVIDKMGGIEIDISEKEAKHLSETNYISKKSNRNIKPGRNLLNGDQALGYARIRYVSTADGTANDFGRVKRHRNIAEAVLNKCKSQSMIDNLALIKDIAKGIETDMPLSQMLTYAENMFDDEFTLKTGTIPVDGSFYCDRFNGASVLMWDKEVNCNALKH